MTAPSRPFVIVAHALPREWLARLIEHCDCLIGPESGSGPGPEVWAALPDAQGLFTLLTDRVDEALLAQAPRLRVVSNMAVGVDNIDLAACTRRGLPVGHTPGVLTEATADLTLALLLAAARRLPASSRDAREGRWTTWSPTGWLGADVHGATLGIVGLGKIGAAVATRAKGFGLQLLYASRGQHPQVEAQLGAARVSLEDLLQRSDFVSLHVPLTPETRHLINERTLRLMKRTAILINTSRGGTVDSGALARALAEGGIAGAALDVTDPEPLPPDHPLYQLPNCFITPHVGSATVGARKRMAELACENLLAGLEGRRLPHCANPEVYHE
jgi:lactate dehydrogenase-like 2-hydroxyacid dehydrogenase